MNTLRNFTLRVFIILFPVLLALFVFLNFQTLTKLEVSLLSLLTIGLPWLFHALLLYHDHQSRANKALLSFCTSIEGLLTGGNSLEKTTKEPPKEMMAELRIMQNIIGQIVQEKEKKSPPKRQRDKINDHAPLSPGAKPLDNPLETPLDNPLDTLLDTPSNNAFPSSVEKVHKLEEVDSIDINKNKNKTQQKEKNSARTHLLNIIEKALNADRIEMLLQPIVSLPQRKARHFECFSRIREEDGTIYTPDHFVNLAEEENLIRLVDNAMLFRCIQMARSSVKKNFDVSFFCNISQHTLSDKLFFESLLEFFHSNRELAHHIVFEFHEEAIKNNIEKIEPFLKKLHLFDCRFSIDQVTSLDLDIEYLKELNFKYIKFHSSILNKAIGIKSGQKQVEDFKKACDLNNMDVIISHIEDEYTLLKLADFNFDYGQGFLFGTPVLSKR